MDVSLGKEEEIWSNVMRGMFFVHMVGLWFQLYIPKKYIYIYTLHSGKNILYKK